MSQRVVVLTDEQIEHLRVSLETSWRENCHLCEGLKAALEHSGGITDEQVKRLAARRWELCRERNAWPNAKEVQDLWDAQPDYLKTRQLADARIELEAALLPGDGEAHG